MAFLAFIESASYVKSTATTDIIEENVISFSACKKIFSERILFHGFRVCPLLPLLRYLVHFSESDPHFSSPSFRSSFLLPSITAIALVKSLRAHRGT